MSKIITISRQFGSGGHSIAQQISNKLNIPFYDGDIVNEIVARSGYSRDMVEKQGEHTSNASKWLDLAAASTAYFQSPQDEIFQAQRELILEYASAGPCVIVGRCADFILRQEGIDCLNVLIYADMEHRAERIIERYGELEGISATKRIQKKDKQRKAYYKYYTDQTWGDFKNYDICLDSGSIGEEKCVDIICNIVE